MFKKVWIASGLLAAAALSGRVVVPARPVVHGPEIYAPRCSSAPSSSAADTAADIGTGTTGETLKLALFNIQD